MTLATAGCGVADAAPAPPVAAGATGGGLPPHAAARESVTTSAAMRSGLISGLPSSGRTPTARGYTRRGGGNGQTISPLRCAALSRRRLWRRAGPGGLGTGERRSDAERAAGEDHDPLRKRRRDVLPTYVALEQGIFVRNG